MGEKGEEERFNCRELRRFLVSSLVDISYINQTMLKIYMSGVSGNI